MKNHFEGFKPILIYVFRIPDKEHADCLKVGETTLHDQVDNLLSIKPNATILNNAARKRINQYTQTAGIHYDLLYTELAVIQRKNGRIDCFHDAAVHQVLLRSRIQRKGFSGNEGQGKEWFVTDLETVKRAIAAVKEGRQSLTAEEVTIDQSPIVFRPEQQEAIEKALKRFKKGNQMLWNAKMRFGKTLSALQVVKEMQFKRTLILTHRPVVDDGWFEDFQKIFYDTPTYHYGSKNKGESFENLERLHREEQKHFVYFASLQDLRGAQTVGGKFDKDNDILSANWDFLIVDEAHEGTQTELGQAVITELIKKNTKVLNLSGTPFNLLENFKEDEIYTWDYVMEQRAKAEWDKTHFGDPNPYAELPQMNIYTYNLGALMGEYEDGEIAFNFREFFRTDEGGKFKHEKDVTAFLNLLTQEDEESMYPFANERYRSIFRHTLWMVPGVKEAKALSALLQTHPVFQHFKVVNVAGNGDEDKDEENRDALTMVNAAIGDNPDQTRTITLSCGRLTTGVTIKAWTGVLMLSGSYSTAASSYMQTIFRVQSPATINGRIKEDCYVFDFAPDRTLQVLATVPRVSTKAGTTDDNQRKALGEFLNFCPVISIEGSTMKALDAPHMLQQLKRAYIEKVVRNGFEDGYLYNDKLMKLSDIEVKAFNDLKRIIGQTKALGNAGEIDINRQGLTQEEYEEIKRTEKKNKKELTEEEKKRLDELKEKSKLKADAISILRGISIRMPLLIYGADIQDENKELTIDNFTQLVDDTSWEEFMHQGVTKAKFNEFKRYYDPEVFSAAGKRIRAIARAADKLTVEDRIKHITNLFSTFRNPDKETVLTPWRVVNMHLGDTLGGYCFFDEKYKETLEEPRYIDRGNVTNEVFDSDTHLLEINSKSGLYPLYLTYNVYRRRLKGLLISPETLEEQQKIWDETIAENIFVLCMSPMAKSITRRTLVGFREAKVNTRYFEDLINQIKNKPENFLAKIVKGKTYWRANNNDTMKFNAVVGNPPYQETVERTSDTPVYNYFMDISFKISEKVTLITPGRYLFNAGKTPAEWNKKILEDKHFKIVWYKPNSTDVFPNVDIKGGVAVMFRDATQNFGEIGIYTAYSQLNGILKKIITHNQFRSLSEIIYPQNKFNLSTLYEIHPELKAKIGSNGREKRLTTSIFSLKEIFFENARSDYDVKIIGLVNNNRQIRYLNKSLLDASPNFAKYKIIVPKSNGSGAIGEVLSTPLIGEPLIGYTQSFIGIGAFNTFQEAEAAIKYVKTKFARTLLGILKVTQDNSKEKWRYIPLQDFTPSSDIDWNQSVPDIDQQLYKKYDLNEEEQQFIEEMIKPM